MSSGGPSKDKSSHSDPSSIAITPLQGSFHRFSVGSRTRSLSPRKRGLNQPLHIRMDLTETQMDRVTEAFTNRVRSSPSRNRHRADTSSKMQGRKTSSVTSRVPSNGDDYDSRVDSSTFSDLMPLGQDVFSPSIAERRHRKPPTPIRTSDIKSLPRGPFRSKMVAVPETVSPLAKDSSPSPAEMNEDDVSIYSQEDNPMPQSEAKGRPKAQPKGQPNSHSTAAAPLTEAVLETYQNWARLHGPFDSPEPIVVRDSPTHRPRRSKSDANQLAHQSVHPRISGHAQPAPDPEPSPAPAPACGDKGEAMDSDKESPLFSPLALYFRDQNIPHIKKGEKTLIGQNGWLERTGGSPEKKTPQKKGGIIDSIKKIAKDMTDFTSPTRRPQNISRESQGSQLSISLDAREQSLLYCELEFHLNNALNQFINAELDRGRLVPDKLKKIADSWSQMGRPKVIGFRYDLETQLELVQLHLAEFDFHGRRQGNPVEISGVLHAMKINARAMRVRTFCQPDSVIAKQVVDSQSLFNLIGASDAQQIALAEIAQFFKVIIERETDKKQREMQCRNVTQSQIAEQITNQAAAQMTDQIPLNPQTQRAVQRQPHMPTQRPSQRPIRMPIHVPNQTSSQMPHPMATQMPAQLHSQMYGSQQRRP
ncbi:hypothetical protein S40293_08728 [Stachybotrys chartarum IBT 40293]|nr:hypothetical protein S40293_08728 [Stachybotrys chartarum IBT 40293]